MAKDLDFTKHSALKQQELKRLEAQRRGAGLRFGSMTKKQKIITSIAGVLIIGAIGLGMFAWYSNSSSAYIKKDDYQALFLTNNQVYFGKLQRLNDGSYRLTDVYYIQSDTQSGEAAAQEATDPAQEQSNKQPTLVKLGNELHGPTDEIIVRDNQVLFWENMKPDSKVSKAIESYRSK